MSRHLTRRHLILSSAAIAATATLPPRRAFAQNGTIRIGYVSPRSGALSGISESDGYVIDAIRATLGDTLETTSGTYAIEIIEKDTQSDPNRAGDMASDLIFQDEVDIVLVGSTPDTTNPVADLCELNGVPCISAATPWQSWYFGRGGVPGEKSFKYTNHFFWGAEDLMKVYFGLWNGLETNKVVGALWPNDPDGIAFSDSTLGFPPALQAAGFTLVDPGRYTNLKDDFSAEINAFKAAGVEIVTGVMLPPDLATFMAQAKQQGFAPKFVTVAKAALTPKGIAGFPNGLGENLSGEVYWGPQYPFTSSLTGETTTALAEGYTMATGNQWLQGTGYVHALFEVAVDVLKRAAAIEPDAIVEAMNATDLTTCVGPVKWGGFDLAPNVAKTPLAGGQWQADGAGGFRLVCTFNATAPEVAIDGTLLPKVW
ncbi:ABC transporter substrate-binding protein [Pseudotabrizicola alkalilacus]|uniref:ABC transporter substrate-binding protein n=1 Tax=Pseudotabrizicola alkalilacus TaxID=2305252 RepID=A0A411Z2Z4_9RHOB|nr:ABC transporter substrate-binding protein [Pseudotabrizicola alkalilacus]RGP37437.1 ABC transporter substrate-binding protein [Pseudotabrizicola alkalilacus]